MELHAVMPPRWLHRWGRRWHIGVIVAKKIKKKKLGKCWGVLKKKEPGRAVVGHAQRPKHAMTPYSGNLCHVTCRCVFERAVYVFAGQWHFRKIVMISGVFRPFPATSPQNKFHNHSYRPIFKSDGHRLICRWTQVCAPTIGAHIVGVIFCDSTIPC